jgi:hypothetical protein
MTKQVLYTYLGTNGTICSPVHLEDVYYIRKYRLTADQGKRLTCDGKTYHDTVVIPEADLPLWKEVAGQK